MCAAGSLVGVCCWLTGWCVLLVHWLGVQLAHWFGMQLAGCGAGSMETAAGGFLVSWGSTGSELPLFRLCIIDVHNTLSE